MRIEIIEICEVVKTLHAANAQRFTIKQRIDVVQTFDNL
jgi:hypothetical protein